MDYSDWKVVANGVLVIGTLLGGFIVAEFGFSTVFYMMAVLAFVSFLGLLLNPSLDSRIH